MDTASYRNAVARAAYYHPDPDADHPMPLTPESVTFASGLALATQGVGLALTLAATQSEDPAGRNELMAMGMGTQVVGLTPILCLMTELVSDLSNPCRNVQHPVRPPVPAPEARLNEAEIFLNQALRRRGWRASGT
jgi:hypothetical protein